ncbi:MAG: helix-turn-helix domain-containing protein [Candidatus Scalindua sp.]|nr:helix-turn-helix domain-containing protein [Candidatus Scalindua sp.]
MKSVCIKENMNLKLARTKAKVSQLELSIKSNMLSQTDLSLIERGLKLPTKEQAERIAKALHVNVNEIFPAKVSTR